MKIFKLILIIFLSVLLTASLTLNIIFFKSSYASLLIRHDKDMFYCLADNSTKNLYPSSFLQSKNKSLELFLSFDDSNDYISYHFYVDENSELSFKIIEMKNNKSTHYYLSGNTLYVYDEESNSKIKSNTSNGDDFLYMAIASTKIDKLLPSIENSNEQVEIDFNSSYLVGLEYEIDINNDTSYTYHFDLKENLRSVDVESKNSKEYTIIININNEQIQMPYFGDYTTK